MGEGLQKRDFIHVDDVVRAMILATKIKGFDTFNVGTGISYSLNDVVKKINNLLGKDIKPEYLPIPKSYSYPMQHEADITKAKKVLGFEAKITIDEGLLKQLKCLNE